MTAPDFQCFEAVGALVVVLDLDQHIVYWNRPCSDLTGYSLEEVRGRCFSDFLLVPEEVEPVKAVLAKLSSAEQPSRLANYWVSKTGEQHWIAWSNTLTQAPDAQAQYIIKTGIDRSEAKRVEDALRTSEARLAGVIAVATDAIIAIDSEQRISIYNQGAEKIFGWSAAEVLGKPLDMLLPLRFRAVHAQHVRDFADGEVAARQMGQRKPEIFGLRKNGEEFPAQAAISKLDVDGSWLFTVVLRDVTQQRQREKERELLANLGAALVATLDYDAVLTSIAQAVVQNLADCCALDLVDKDGQLRRLKVVHRDPARTALCERLQRIELDRQRPHLVSSVLESRRPSLIAEVSSQFLESVAQSDEHLRLLQELAPRSLMVVPLLAHGELLGTLSFVASSPSRAYGPEDLRLAEELAFRAALAIENARLYASARTHSDDLREANRQMVIATIRAQELTGEAEAAKARAEKGERELAEVARFRETFIGIVGHDLRTPLGAINLAVTTLRGHGHLDEHDETAVGRIAKSAERMRRMISQLLDLTRARLGGGFPLEPKLTDLREVCRKVAEEFAAPIQLDIDGDVTGTWDPDRLEEALSNIVANAIEHAAPGTAAIVAAHADGGQVVVEIRNQGKPIPPDVLPFIFEPFRRAKRKKSATGNLGLGLYIANEIARSHGGTLDVRSSNELTVFVMRLPRSHPASRPGWASAPEAPRSRPH